VSPREQFRLVIFGVQGSGKGTQAELIAKRFGLTHVATGDIFRREVSHQTKLGKLAARYLTAGKLVSDAVTNAMVAKRLRRADVRRRGFILDGYPRNANQLRALHRFRQLTHAIEIRLPEHEAVRRITGRRSCRCGHVYHLEYNPPSRPGRCDYCGRRLYIRDDDRPAVIRRRIRDYQRQTTPLLDYFRRRGKLLAVDGQPPIPTVFKSILAQLKSPLASEIFPT